MAPGFKFRPGCERTKRLFSHESFRLKTLLAYRIRNKYQSFAHSGLYNNVDQRNAYPCAHRNVQPH